ncbi:MAG: PQQ-binding-like beta-propeller repeat protein, partial [Candidatus Dormibacteraceae bacterium]
MGLLLLMLQPGFAQGPGTVLWSRVIGGTQNYPSPAMGPDGAIYAVSGAGTFSGLYSFSPAGNTNWLFFASGTIAGSPAVAPDGTVYATCSDGNVYSISSIGGRNWIFNTS